MRKRLVSRKLLTSLTVDITLPIRRTIMSKLSRPELAAVKVSFLILSKLDVISKLEDKSLSGILSSLKLSEEFYEECLDQLHHLSGSDV